MWIVFIVLAFLVTAFTGNLFLGLAIPTAIFAFGALWFHYRDNSSGRGNNTSNNSNNNSTSGSSYSARTPVSQSKARNNSTTPGSGTPYKTTSYDQQTVYRVDYGDRCRVCYYYSFKESHQCAVNVKTTGVIKKITNNEGETENIEEFTGCLYDGLGQCKWKCEHKHPNVTLATKCAREHYKMHQRGTCNCSYFAKSLPKGLGNKASAQLYLIKHERFQALKIGVSSNSTNDRLEEHLKNGWKLIAVWKGVNGRKAYETEQATIASWRKQGYPIAVSYKNMPQKGATETVNLHYVTQEDIDSMIEEFTKKFKYNPTKEI